MEKYIDQIDNEKLCNNPRFFCNLSILKSIWSDVKEFVVAQKLRISLCLLQRIDRETSGYKARLSYPVDLLQFGDGRIENVYTLPGLLGWGMCTSGIEDIMKKTFDRVWAEIDLGSIEHNLKEARRIIDRNTIIMAVVKADAYGHGAVNILESLIESGIDRLAVATLDEALYIRKRGYYMPLQILGYTSPERAMEILDYNLIQTVFDVKLAEGISEAAQRKNLKARIHIKINIGMNRIGFSTSDKDIDEIRKIYRMPGIEIEGIMTHFSNADSSERHTYL
jgi:Alanine racemase